MKHNVIIVGNGLFGSIAATLARAEGHKVTVVSDNNPQAGSLASGCVLAPSWLSSLEKEHIADAMSVLHELYTVYNLEFATNILGRFFKASRVDPRAVLVKADVPQRVTEVGNGRVRLGDGTVLQGKVLVAAGAWSSSLLGVLPPMRGLWGASLSIKAKLEVPRIHVYAPYRQAVAFQMRPGEVWMGDGTALVESTWKAEEDQRVAATISRSETLFGLSARNRSGYKVNVGVRPYVVGHKAGYYERVAVNTWVSTGGAKNGTVLAAWQARRFVKEALR